MTTARVNTLAPESLAAAAAIADDVRVISFLSEGERAALELQTLLGRYRAANPRIGVEARSIKRAADLQLAQELGIAALLPLGGPNVVVVAGDRLAGRVALRFDAGQPNHEEQLTNALRRATTTTTQQRAYVVSGHGEPELRDAGPFGLQQLRTALDARGVELVPLPLLLASAQVPSDARLLIVPPTTQPHSEVEAQALQAFVDGGGHLLLLLEPDQRQPLQQALAGRFGITILLDDVVIDESPFSSLLGGADTATGSTQLGHAISRPLGGALTHFVRATALTTAPMDGLESVAVISTSAEARAPKNGAHGPLPLLIAADGHKKPLGRAVVVADASFLQNVGIALGANRDLAINSVLWLVQDESFIQVRPRAKTGALIFLSPSSRQALAFVLLFLIPVTLAAAGAALNALRR